jgi:hypothetical protein
MSEDIKIRAARAEQLLADDVLIEAFNGFNHDAVARVLSANLSDPTECVAAVASFQASQEFLEKLRGYVTDGKAAGRNKIYVA